MRKLHLYSPHHQNDLLGLLFILGDRWSIVIDSLLIPFSSSVSHVWASSLFLEISLFWPGLDTKQNRSSAAFCVLLQLFPVGTRHIYLVSFVILYISVISYTSYVFSVLATMSCPPTTVTFITHCVTHCITLSVTIKWPLIQYPQSDFS